MCVIFQACGKRRKRSVSPFGEESSESATVTVGPLYTAAVEGKKPKTYCVCNKIYCVNQNEKLTFSLTYSSSPSKDRPNAAAYSEYIVI